MRKLGADGGIHQLLELRAVVYVDRLRQGVAGLQRRLQRARVAHHDLQEEEEEEERRAGTTNQKSRAKGTGAKPKTTSHF